MLTYCLPYLANNKYLRDSYENNEKYIVYENDIQVWYLHVGYCHT